MGILERIKDIELELSRTQKNKATTTHIGMLKGQVKYCMSACELMSYLNVEQ